MFLRKLHPLCMTYSKPPKTTSPLKRRLSKKPQRCNSKQATSLFTGQSRRQEDTLPDVSDIPLWRGRKKDGMPLDFIKAHYGHCLAAFGAAQDTLFQDQLRARDPKLLQGVSNQLQEEGHGRKLRDFVKPRAVRTERELESFDLETLKQAHRIKGLLSRRRLKKEAPQES